MVAEQTPEYESEWATICSIAEKLGCAPETLRKWVRRAERGTGKRPGPTTAERERNKELERENRELRRTNEIPRKASAFLAAAHLAGIGVADDAAAAAVGVVAQCVDAKTAAAGLALGAGPFAVQLRRKVLLGAVLLGRPVPRTIGACPCFCRSH